MPDSAHISPAPAYGRAPLFFRPTATLCAVVGGALLLTAWFAPAWLVPAAMIVFSAALATPGGRAMLTWPGLAVCVTVLGFFYLKDRVMGGPLDAVAGALGAPVRFHGRQPETASFVAQFAAVGAGLSWLPLLRFMLGEERVLIGWIRGVVLVLTGLAAAVLTHPAATMDYGHGSQLGAVVSRNAAAGAFALGAILAAGLMVDAWRQGRPREWPWAAAAAGVCTAAVAGLGSRGGLFALTAGAVFLVVRLGGRRARLTLVGLVVLALGVLLAAPATLARLADLGREYRLELWAGSGRALAHAPWGGLGAGGFETGFALLSGMVPQENMRVTHPDSSWVLMFTEWGLVGMAIMAGAVWYLLRGRRVSEEREGLRAVVLAGLVAWAVAACGDISLHRPVLLVIGLPLVAAACPLDGERNRQGRGVLAVAGALVAVMLAAASLWAVRVNQRAGDPASVDAAMVGLMPLDSRVNHVLGCAALARGEAEAAARYFEWVAAVNPANTAAFEGYGRALMSERPDLALSFWKRLLVVSDTRAPGLLAAEMARSDGTDAIYWMRAAEERPELWVVPADTDRAGAQRCYERWLMQPASVRARSRVIPALGAMARWGGTVDLTDWLKTGPRLDASEIAPAARMLRTRGRDDLAWVWLSDRLPVPASVKAEPDPGLKARVLANPNDLVAAARLLDQTPPGEESLRLLERLVARPGAPAAFRLRLARALQEDGRRAEALDLMLAAAEAQAAAR